MKGRVVAAATVAVVVLAVGVTFAVVHGTGASTDGAGSGSGSGTGSTRAAPTAHAGASTVRWSACSDATLNKAGAVCTRLAVPLDYAHPTGPQIKIALSMVRHTSSGARYQGVILANPGGPGQSGLSLATLGKSVPNGVGGDYDWIGFDPRGVGDSVPALSCDASEMTGPRMPYDPTTAKLTTEWLQTSAAYAKACGEKGGELLDHATTADSARDMDSIRKALGQRQISYYGYSYGTYLGAVYGTLFPTHVRRMVLDSNVDPRTVFYQGNLDQDTAFERNIRLWFAWLASHDATYHLGSTTAAVSALFYRTQDHLQRDPIGQVGGDEWNDVFNLAGYTQQAWPQLGATFADVAHGGSGGDLAPLYQYVDTPGDDNSHAMYLATECTDAPWPKSAAKNVADSRRIARTAPFLTWQNMWFNAPCITWPAPAHAAVAIDGSQVASTLLVDQTLDAATPYPGSLEMRRLYPHSVLLALPGGTSHANSLSGDACEDGLIARYLGTGALPPRKAGSGPDATCAPLPLPSPQG